MKIKSTTHFLFPILLLSCLMTLNSISAENSAPTDPLFSKQWALKNNGQVILKAISDLERVSVTGIVGNDIHWRDTSLESTAKKDLIVAVIDSGVDIDHPDLKNRIWYNEKLCLNAPNAKNLPCNGFNFLDGNNNLTDDVGHGTHVAGVIAANKNGIGIVGAADPRIKIMPIKVLNNQVNGFVYNGKLITDVIADAMVFAIKNGAEVINLSLGWPKLIDTQKVRDAFKMAEEQNVVVIAATGNNSKDLPTFPCAYESVICVGAIDNRGALTDFTNFGSKVDVVAPGEYIISTIPTKSESRVLRIANYDVKRGSSQAAPYVTAAVATLKLLTPQLSNDNVRSYLYRSARPLQENKNNKTIKFGSLDFSALLDIAKTNETESFVIPQLKSITEIKFQASDSRFKFNLPLKNLSSIEFNGSLCLNANSNGSQILQFDQTCFLLKNLKGHSSTFVEISGLITNLKADSHIKVNFSIEDKIFETSLVFSRDLNQDTDVLVSPITGGNFDDMGVISGERRLSRMVRVMDKHHRIDYPEYFFIEKGKQTATNTVVSILTKESGRYVVKTIALPLVNRVLSIHRQDINLDGSIDTFIYALSAKKDELLFFSFDKSLNPLFGKYSKWTFPLSTFEGLPIDGGVEKFEWLKINNPVLGNIVVPSLFKNYTMPEVDNSKNILERVTSSANHQFYLSPTLDKNLDMMKIELRVVDSVASVKKMQKDFHLYENESIQLIKPLPQTDEQSKKGEIHSLAALVSNDEKSFLELTLNQNEMKPSSLESVASLESSLIYPLLSSESARASGDFVFTSLLNRSSAEFLVKTNASFSRALTIKQEWENPVIGLIAAFSHQNDKLFLIENRSSVTLLNTGGERSDLPIYRDSSFPGQTFSESLMPVLSAGRPGVFINSTLIYGERLYTMMATDKGLIRPLGLSLDIPTGCVPLNPETLEDKSSFHYAFLCNGPNKELSLKFLPMSDF